MQINGRHLQISCTAIKLRNLLLLFLLIGGVASAQSRISQDEAKRIVHYALKAGDMDEATVDVSSIKYGYAPDFYSFEATWPNPDGSPMLGSYAVNPWTGDIWQLVVCKQITSAQLRRIQRSIRSRFHLQASEYVALHKKTPVC